MKAPVLLVSYFNFPKTQGEKSLANTTRVDVSGHQSSVTLCKTIIIYRKHTSKYLQYWKLYNEEWPKSEFQI
jgi:hypothetical protein